MKMELIFASLHIEVVQNWEETGETKIFFYLTFTEQGSVSEIRIFIKASVKKIVNYIQF